jgi:hypothetical protein
MTKANNPALLSLDRSSEQPLADDVIIAKLGLVTKRQES